MDQRKFTIPYIKIEPQKLKEYFSIMEDGNRLLKKWARHFLGNRKLRIFREKLFMGEYVDDIPKDDYKKIMRVKSIDEIMLHGFAACVTLRTNIWAKRADDWKISFNDLYQEANFAFLDAFYGYLGVFKKAQFITYMWRVIDRRLSREIENQKLQLVPPSADGARELIHRFESYRQERSQTTFDEFVIEKSLTNEEANILSCALANITVADCTFVEGKNAENFQQLHDKNLVVKIQKCISLVKLTDFQRELLEAACQDDYGWKAKLAKKYGFTRTRAGQAFEEACQKVRLEYLKMDRQF